MRTQLRMGALQRGHCRSAGAQSAHTRWPQGTRTVHTLWSGHTLQVRSSRRRCSCSSASRAPGGTQPHPLGLGSAGLLHVPTPPRTSTSAHRPAPGESHPHLTLWHLPTGPLFWAWAAQEPCGQELWAVWNRLEAPRRSEAPPRGGHRQGLALVGAHTAQQLSSLPSRSMPGPQGPRRQDRLL